MRTYGLNSMTKCGNITTERSQGKRSCGTQERNFESSVVHRSVLEIDHKQAEREVTVITAFRRRLRDPTTVRNGRFGGGIFILVFSERYIYIYIFIVVNSDLGRIHV